MDTTACKEGWTKWLSQDNQKYGTDSDIEPLPTVDQMVRNLETSTMWKGRGSMLPIGAFLIGN
jgi:hypothetical protein